MSLPPFHLAFPVDDLAAARRFYGEAMGCGEGRSSDEWIDFDFHGHQIVAHLTEWEALAERLRAAGTAFVIEPTIRFKGQPGEQATMFLRDPAGNALEFKAFADIGKLFAK
jgi:uncharacterized protein